MKKISCVLCLIMLVSIMLPVFGISGSAAALPAIKGDVDGDGLVAASDVDAVTEICFGKKEIPAASSAEFKAANVVDSEIDMEDLRRIVRVAKGITGGESLYPSVADANAALIGYFNAIVNQVKTSEFTDKNNTVFFSHDITKSTSGEMKMSRYNTIKKEYVDMDFSALAEMLGGDVDESELAGIDSIDESTDAYSAVRTAKISNSRYPIYGETVASNLTGSDIKSISVEMTGKVDLLSELPSTITVGTKTYDISAHKTTAAALPSCLKITVELQQETYESIKALDASALSVREKALDTSFREMIGSFPMTTSDDTNGFTMSMTMDCNSATSDLSIVYYVDTATMLPIAAVYNSNIVSNQDMLMTGDIPIVGSMRMEVPTSMSSQETDYYLFTETFA